MAMSVGSLIKNLASNGHFGASDLRTATINILDGKGVTRPEKALWKKGIDAVMADKDVYTTPAAVHAYANIKNRMKHFSESKGIYGPTFSAAEVIGIAERAVDWHNFTHSAWMD